MAGNSPSAAPLTPSSEAVVENLPLKTPSSLSDLEMKFEKMSKTARSTAGRIEKPAPFFLVKNPCDSQRLYFLSPTGC